MQVRSCFIQGIFFGGDVQRGNSLPRIFRLTSNQVHVSLQTAATDKPMAILTMFFLFFPRITIRSENDTYLFSQ
jgi:hypothetical protein